MKFARFKLPIGSHLLQSYTYVPVGSYLFQCIIMLHCCIEFPKCVNKEKVVKQPPDVYYKEICKLYLKFLLI